VEYPYAASYYAKALETIRRRAQSVDDIGGMVVDMEMIADQALDGVWNEDTAETDSFGILPDE
jgi:hypothetical protein